MTERTKLTEDEVIEPAAPPLELSEADDLATFDITDVDALLNDKDTIIKTADAVRRGASTTDALRGALGRVMWP